MRAANTSRSRLDDRHLTRVARLRVDSAARAARPIRPQHRVPAHLGDGPVQLPLPVLHAGDRITVASQVGDPLVRRDRRGRAATRAARAPSVANYWRRTDDPTATP